MGLDPDSPTLPKLCINLQRGALGWTRTVDVDGVATEVPYQCAGLTEFCQYEDCVAKQRLKAPERPRAVPLDREDLATMRLFVDPERRAALAGGKKRVHAVWGIAPKNRSECQRCRRAALSDEEKYKIKKPGNYCTDPFGKGCKNPDPSHKRNPCPDCKAEQKRRAAAASTS